AYAVKLATEKRDGYQGAIWLAPFDGSRPATQLTSGAGQDSSPRWSPDAARLAFLSDRGEPPKGRKRAPRNVYLLELEGGEARRLSSFTEDCADLTWSADGRSRAFVIHYGDHEESVCRYYVSE